MYRLYATYAGARFVPVPLRADLSLDTDAMLAAIEREKPALVWLASPNNPTGTQFDAHGVEQVVRATPGLAVVDEAYFAFAPHSFLPRVLEFPNLVVVRTLSKIGMAGLRLGYAVSHRAWTDEIDKVRSPYNVNSLTQAAAQFLLRDDADLRRACGGNPRRARARDDGPRAHCPASRCSDSAANFFVARFPDGPATFTTLQGGRHPREERPRLAPAAGELPADHRRHADRKRRAAGGAGAGADAHERTDAQRPPPARRRSSARRPKRTSRSN